jgi:hypothetical protein
MNQGQVGHRQDFTSPFPTSTKQVQGLCTDDITRLFQLYRVWQRPNPQDSTQLFLAGIPDVSGSNLVVAVSAILNHLGWVQDDVVMSTKDQVHATGAFD